MSTPYGAGHTVNVAAVVAEFEARMAVAPPIIRSPTFNPVGSYLQSLGRFRLATPINATTPSLMLTALPTAAVATTANIYYVLHRVAVQLTRIRKVHFYQRTDNVGPAALATDYTAPAAGDYMGYYTSNAASYNTFANTVEIPLPPVPPATTPLLTPSTDLAFRAFVDALKAAVQAIQTDPTKGQELTGACHASCHGACHGARGRR